MESTTFCLILTFLQVSLIFGVPQIQFPEFSQRRYPSRSRKVIRPGTPPPQTLSTSTIYQAEDLRSLCPGLQENALRLYRYDKITRKCYRGGDRGPCGTNMIFYGVEGDRVNGTCDCDYSNQDRELVYHPESKQCHFVYSQAYCRPKQWLVYNEETKPICVSNPCHRLQRTSSSSEVEYVPYRGRCVELGSQASCDEEKIIGFVKGELLPKCTFPKNTGFTGLSVGVPKLRCKSGSVMSINGSCRSVYKLKLN